MVFEKIRAIICEQLEIEGGDITADTMLEDLGADYLDLVDIVMDLEDEFDVEITDETLEGFSTVGDIVSFIEEV